MSVLTLTTAKSELGTSAGWSLYHDTIAMSVAELICTNNDTFGAFGAYRTVTTPAVGQLISYSARVKSSYRARLYFSFGAGGDFAQAWQTISASDWTELKYSMNAPGGTNSLFVYVMFENGDLLGNGKVGRFSKVMADASDQMAALRGADQPPSIKLNTLDFQLENPAVVPAIDDLVACTNPVWSGVLKSIESADPVDKVGHVYYNLAAVNADVAGASAAPFNLSDIPSPNGNPVPNPQFDAGQTSWTNYAFPGATAATRSIDAAASPPVGTKAYKQVYGGANTYEGIVAAVVLPTGAIVFSLYLKGNAGGEQINVYCDNGGITPIQATFTLMTSWQRFTLAVTGSTGGTSNLYIRTGGGTFWATGIMVEPGAVANAYNPTTLPQKGYSGLRVKTSKNTDGSQSIAGSCTIYADGLWPAMTFLLSSANQKLAQANFSVRNVTVHFFKTTPYYSVEFGDPIVTMDTWISSASETGNDSLVANTDFEDPLGDMPRDWFRDYEGTTGSPKRDTSTALSGSASLAITSTAAQSQSVASAGFPVTPGEIYYFSAWVKSDVVTTDGFYFRILFSNVAQNFPRDSEPISDIVTDGPLTTSWQKFSGRVAVPVGKTWARVAFYNYFPNVTAKINIDQVFGARAVDTGMIQDNAITRTKITDGEVITPKLAAGSVTADKIAAVIVLASLLRGGSGTAHTEMDGGGFRSYDSGGNLVVNVPTDGSPVTVNANLIAHTLEALGAAIFRGAAEVAFGATMQLDASQGDPIQAPSLAQGWDTISTPIDVLDGVPFSHWSLCYDGSGGAGGATKVFWQIAYNAQNSHWYVVELLASTRAVNRYIDMSASTAFVQPVTLYSVVRHSTDIYVLMSSGGFWQVMRFTASTLAAVGATNPTMPVSPPAFPSITSDGTNLYILDAASPTTLPKWQKYDSAMAVVGGAVTTSGYTPTTKPSSCVAGNADFGAFRMVVAHHDGLCIPFDSTGVAQPDEVFNFPASSWTSGITYGDALGDGARFWTQTFQGDASIVKHTNWTWATSVMSYWVGYTWYDSNATGGTHESAISPRTVIAMGRRKKLTITAPAIPGAGGADEPNNIRYYMVLSNTDPGVTGNKLQATQSGTTYVAVSYASGGAADPASNNFPTGTPAILKSVLGNVRLKGDGLWRLDNYKARAINNANQGGVANNTFTLVSLQTEDYDPNSNFASSRYTAPVTGYYDIRGRVVWSPGAQQGRSAVTIYKNGTEVPGTRNGSHTSTNSAIFGNETTTTLYLTAGDYIELYAYHTFGAGATLVGSGNDYCELVVAYAGEA